MKNGVLVCRHSLFYSLPHLEDNSIVVITLRIIEYVEIRHEDYSENVTAAIGCRNRCLLSFKTTIVITFFWC